MRRILVAVTVGSFLLAGGALAQGGLEGHGGPGWFGEGMGAAAPGGPAMGGGEHMVAALTKTLGLTADQLAAWEKIRDNTKATVQPLIQQERQLREDVRTALEAGGADPTAIGNKVIAAHDLGTKIKAARDAGVSAFRALLTPDQQTKFDLLQQMRTSMRPMHRMGPPQQQ